MPDTDIRNWTAIQTWARQFLAAPIPTVETQHICPGVPAWSQTPRHLRGARVLRLYGIAHIDAVAKMGYDVRATRDPFPVPPATLADRLKG